MAQIRKDVEYLIYLLSCALNETKPSYFENVDYSALFELAEKHQIYNIIAPLVVEDENLPFQLKQKFNDYRLTELYRMIVINNERQAVYSFLEEKGIKYMPLKGLVIRNYYPNESMRQMSDNDILYDVKFRDELDKFMKKQGYKTVATGENSDDYFKAPYCTFEFHRTLFFEEKEFCPEFDNLWENATLNSQGKYMYNMGIDDVYIYSVCHMYKHFSTAGCGIRFLADNYLILKKEKDNINWNYVNAFLDSCGILDFEQKTRKLAFKLFELNELDADDIKLLEIFINYGIYGDGNIALSNKLKSFDNSSIKNAKLKYLRYRMFPPIRKMKADYRTLEKHPYLLPFYYIYRLFKAVFNGKKTIGEITSLKNIDSD